MNIEQYRKTAEWGSIVGLLEKHEIPMEDAIRLVMAQGFDRVEALEEMCHIRFEVLQDDLGYPIGEDLCFGDFRIGY